MKAIIQRVTSASVTVCDECVSSIGRGLCVLVGISTDDNANDVDWLARKLLNIRLFEEPATSKQWMQSVSDQQLEILCFSQFTLYPPMKGNRPYFGLAMQRPQAQELYGTLLQKLREQYTADRIKDGVFGAMMQVHIQNDGPVTLEIESPPRTKKEHNAEWWNKDVAVAIKKRRKALRALQRAKQRNNSTDILRLRSIFQEAHTIRKQVVKEAKENWMHSC